MKKDNDQTNFKDASIRELVLEQYKMLIESINKLNETRESSNTFWVAANSIGISALAYLRDTHQVPQSYKSIFLMSLIILGIVFSLSWLSYLTTIKRALENRHDILINIENKLPIPLFTKVFSLSLKKVGKTTLTNKEMLVPSLFLIGYLFFAILLIFFPQEVIATLQKD